MAVSETKKIILRHYVIVKQREETKRSKRKNVENGKHLGNQEMQAAYVDQEIDKGNQEVQDVDQEVKGENQEAVQDL